MLLYRQVPLDVHTRYLFGLFVGCQIEQLRRDCRMRTSLRKAPSASYHASNTLTSLRRASSMLPASVPACPDSVWYLHHPFQELSMHCSANLQHRFGPNTP